MDNSNVEKQQKMLLRTTISVAVVLFVLSLAIIFMLNALSMGWFSSNKEVDVMGMAVSLTTEDVSGFVHSSSVPGDGDYIPIEDDSLIASVEGTGITIPGSKVEFEIILKNESDHGILVNGFGFEPPRIYTDQYTTYPDVSEYDEVPTKQGTEYYYFGTQLTAELTKIQVGSVQEYSDNPGFLDWSTADFHDAAGENGVPLSSAISSPQRLLSDGFLNAVDPVNSRVVLFANQTGAQYVEVDSGDFILFHIVVTFENADSSQDAYKQFGHSGIENPGKCSRMIYIEFDGVNE